MTTKLTRRSAVKVGLASVAGLALGPTLGATAKNAMSFDEYRSYDGLGLAELVRDGDVSALEILELAVNRATAVNPTINCIVEKLYDRAAQQIKAGLPAGPFAGVPFLLKDLAVALEGTVTTQGSRFFRDWVADYTSTIVTRYQQAGLVIIGKSASPEFGGTPTTESMLFGDTLNPWNLKYSTGGSSGGSAAAVAAGILPLANATDGGGSIRIPASCCGLFGMKTSRGRTPHGPIELASTLSVIHAVSRSVRDSAALLDASAGAELGQTSLPPAPPGKFLDAVSQAPKRLRIGLIKTPVTQSPVDPQCELAAAKAAKLCEDLGHHVEEVHLPIDPGEFFAATGAITGSSMVAKIIKREQQLGRQVTEEDLEPLIWRRFNKFKEYTGEQVIGALSTLGRIAQQVAVVQQDIDVLLSPTLAAPPLEIGKLSLNQDYAPYERAAISVSAFTMLSNATGQPAMSVPLHWTPNGLPVGVMFAGRFGDEWTLYQLAGQLEQAAPWFDKVPPL